MKRIVDLVAFVFVGYVVVSLALPILRPRVTAQFAPVPYSNIVVHLADVVDGRLRVDASFIKNENCILQRFAPVGLGLAGASYLTFTDLDGLGTDFDREAGAQTLRISIDLAGLPIERVELRTRHKCGEFTVDRVFADLAVEG